MNIPRLFTFHALLAAAVMAAPSALAVPILLPGTINLNPPASPTPLFLAGTWTRTLNSDGSATYTNANGGTLILSSSVVYSGAIVVSSNGVINTVAPGNSVTGQTITVSGGGLHVIKARSSLTPSRSIPGTSLAAPVRSEATPSSCRAPSLLPATRPASRPKRPETPPSPEARPSSLNSEARPPATATASTTSTSCRQAACPWMRLLAAFSWTSRAG